MISYDGYDINPNGYGEKCLSVTENTDLILVKMEIREPDQNIYARNVYYVDKNRQVIWQIETKDYAIETAFSGQPFFTIKKNNDGHFLAYNWSGFIYRIDMQTGFAVKVGFQK